VKRRELMDIIEAIRARKSIRGYKSEPVPREVLREILEIATRAPSGLNMQPWEITVVTGKALDSIRKANIEKLFSGDVTRSAGPPIVPQGKYRERQIGVAVQLFQAMGIVEEDKEGRAWWAQRGFRFFDAPAAFIISVDKSLGDFGGLLDIGALMQTICLTALNYGLGTCIEDQATRFPDVLRKYAGIPESHRIVIAIAVGYPDPDFPTNKVQSQREQLENVVTWYD